MELAYQSIWEKMAIKSISSVTRRDLLGRKGEGWVESSVRLFGEHCLGQMPGIPLLGDTHQRLVFICTHFKYSQ